MPGDDLFFPTFRYHGILEIIRWHCVSGDQTVEGGFHLFPVSWGYERIEPVLADYVLLITFQYLATLSVDLDDLLVVVDDDEHHSRGIEIFLGSVPFLPQRALDAFSFRYVYAAEMDADGYFFVVQYHLGRVKENSVL